MNELNNDNACYQFPLSLSQQRLWFLHQLAPNDIAYNICSTLQIDGELCVKSLQLAINKLIERHETLRTVFVHSNDQPLQQVNGCVECTIVELNFSHSGINEAAKNLQEINNRPFDLSTGPLFRVTLFKLNNKQHWLNFCLHHIIADGWSVGIMIKEISILYRFYLSQKSQNIPSPSADPLPDLALQYVDYSVWQNEQWQQNYYQAGQVYWKKQLEEAPLITRFLSDHPPKNNTTGQASIASIKFSKDELLDLIQFSNHSGATVFMSLLSVFYILLSRSTNQKDLIVGTAVANRQETELEDIIGFFVNTLPLRVNLENDFSFSALVKQVKQVTLDAQKHQNIPFDKIVDGLNLARDLKVSPLVQISFVMQNNREETFSLEGTSVSALSFNTTTEIRFDLEVYAEITNGRLGIDFLYKSELYNAETVDALATRYTTLLRSALRQPDSSIFTLPMLTAEQLKPLEQGLLWHSQSIPNDLLVHQLFEKNAVLQPDNIALICGAATLTYRQLNIASNQLAHKLIEQGVTTEARIGIFLPRKPDMIIAMLAILKSGACYVPLDTDYPKQRIEHMLTDSQATLVVTYQHLNQKLPKNIKKVSLDKENNLAQFPTTTPNSTLNSKNLSYIIYTSGSTGLPKGVAVEHRSVVALLVWGMKAFKRYQLEEVLASASICFDYSIFEIFQTLSIGGRIQLVRNTLTLLQPSNHSNHSQFDQVTLIGGVPSAVQVLLHSDKIPKSVNTINLGGEAVRQDLVDELYRLPQVKNIFDVYGPSEDTTFTTTSLREANGKANIGHPISNTVLHIVDQHLQLVPPGVPGELLTGGAGLARGYWNKAKLTAQRFIENPFSPEKSERLYRTGDWVRLNSNNQIEYLGRIDQQTKIRGFRVEISEVEIAISRQIMIKDCVVLVKTDSSKSQFLLAFIVFEKSKIKKNSLPHISDNSSNELVASLETKLSQELPQYMLPSQYIAIDHIPLTPNGKVNHKALENIVPEQTPTFEKPSTKSEIRIASIWSDILRLKKISLFDSFFSLGGHSLLSVKMINRVNQSFEIDLCIKDAFEYPTIHTLAKKIDQQSELKKVNHHQKIPIVPHKPFYPLAPAQSRLWFLDQINISKATYNVAMALKINGSLDVQLFQSSLQQVSQRHENLRTIFAQNNDGPYQTVLEVLPVEFNTTVLESLPVHSRVENAKAIAEQAILREFDLTKGPLWRVDLVRLTINESIFILTMHHIISDAWSVDNLFNELKLIYSGQELKPLAIQYADYAVWHAKLMRTAKIERQRDYWIKQLKDAPPFLDMPFDYPRSKDSNSVGDSECFLIPQDLADKAGLFCTQSKVSLFMLGLSVFAVLLSRYSNQKEVVIGTPVANRNNPDLEPLIGFFVNSLPIRLIMTNNVSFNQLLTQLKETVLDGFDNQDIPFNQIVESLDIERTLNQTPIFQTLFVMNTANHSNIKVDGLDITPFPFKQPLSMFDLILSLTETDHRIEGLLSYDKRLFHGSTISQFIQRYIHLLEQCITKPERPIVELDLRCDKDIALTSRLGQAKKSSPLLISTPSLNELFQHQCFKTPDNAAIQWLNGNQLESISYKQFNQAAERLAIWMIQQGIKQGQTIGITLSKSPNLYITMLSCLKIGAAYVPIDLNYPMHRIHTIMDNAQIKLLIVDDLEHDKISELTPKASNLNCKTITIDPILACTPSALANHHSSQPAPELPAVPSTSPAYILYTSGSTGEPKVWSSIIIAWQIWLTGIITSLD